MKRPDYLSYSDPLSRAAHAGQGDHAEIELPRRHDKILRRDLHRQLDANLTGAIFAEINNERRCLVTGRAACLHRDIQPVIACRFPTEFPRLGRARPKLQGSGVRGERSYPESDGQSFTGFDRDRWPGRRPNLKGAVCFAVTDVGSRYAFYVSGQRFDVGDDRNLDDPMPGVVCLKLVAGFDRAKLVRCVNLD